MEKIMRAIIEILEAAKTSALSTDPIKKVQVIFFGDPVIIPESMLPAIVVAPVNELVSSRGTGTDQADSTIRIKLVQNLKNTLGASATNQDDIKMTEDAIRIFSERDSNGKYRPVSIVGALRAKPELPYQGSSSCQWNGSFSVDYGFTDAR